jgi:heme/copper-type cytochrome/quinol oxidase subunit 2
MAAQSREDGLRRQLGRARELLLAAAAEAAEAQQTGLPAGIVAVVALALAVAFMLGSWHATTRSARTHRAELAALRQHAETLEVGACACSVVHRIALYCVGFKKAIKCVSIYDSAVLA